jgi:O-antigen/teichoic acid export membrane protein
MRAIFTTCLGLAFTAWRAGDSGKVRFDGAMALYLVKIGLPLMTIGAIALILFSFDRLLILTFLGSTLMGYYGISIALLRMLNLFPMVVGQVFAPVMANVYGATLSPRALLKYAARASLVAFCITLGAVAALYFLIPPFIVHFLPKYTYGITAARISLLTGLLLALSVGPGFFLQTIMRQFEYFIVILLSAIAIMSSVLMFFARGHDLSGVAWGMVIGYAVNTAGVWIYTFVFCHREKKTGRESSPQYS